MMDSEKCRVLIEELGITGHEDLGIQNHKYIEIISLGPFTRRIETSEQLIERAETSINATRFNILKENADILLSEVSEIHKRSLNNQQ